MGGAVFVIVLVWASYAALFYKRFKKETGCTKCAVIRALTWPYWVWK